MSKGAAQNAQLFYGQVRVQDVVSFEKVCDKIADRSTASNGDVEIVIAGLMKVLKEHLLDGDTVQVGKLGHFRMIAGSRGVGAKGDFNVSCFKAPRIIFSPGAELRDLKGKVGYDLLKPLTPEEAASGEPEPCDRPHAD
jgi:predicted histone-like DNA-binding protein